MKGLFLSTAIVLGLGVAALGLAVIFGGPGTPVPMATINDAFMDVDFSGLPPLSHYATRDGESLSLRAYPAHPGPAVGSVVLIHGSSASSNSMHVMARSFSRAGYDVYALDVRGHGASGTRGRIRYIGQLEDDLEDFVRNVAPARPRCLAGFSSGGGFVLRVAGSNRQRLFQSYLLLSPFISQDALTYRKDNSGWVSVGIPRFMALTVLNAIGLRSLNDLPVTRFALNKDAKAFLTAEYSYAMSVNFRPNQDYIADIKAIRSPCAVVAGDKDEVFYADRFAEVFRSAGKEISVTLVPETGHVALTLAPEAVAAAVAAVDSMRKRGV
ncbi:MAG: alpha/beta fold hydrolase [Deltaproteobacteria bacterium]|nr:alpha/beta fold hydrolase [Deltaproteobacteria bacterium]